MEIEPLYIKCPECGKWYSHGEVISYTTFGNADCWSDGRVLDGSMPEYNFLPFSRCEGCHSFFWFEDCQSFPRYKLKEYLEANLVERHKMKLIKDFVSNNPNYQEKSIPDFRLNYPYAHYWENLPKYFIKDFVQLLENKNRLNNEREIYCRAKLWQYINDLIRDVHPIIYHFKYSFSFKCFFRFRSTIGFCKAKKIGKELYNNYKDLKNENLKQLTKLLEVKELSEDDLFLLIEAWRELGDFERAKFTLKELTKIYRPNNKKFVRKTKWKLLLKSKAFFKI